MLYIKKTYFKLKVKNMRVATLRPALLGEFQPLSNANDLVNSFADRHLHALANVAYFTERDWAGEERAERPRETNL